MLMGNWKCSPTRQQKILILRILIEKLGLVIILIFSKLQFVQVDFQFWFQLRYPIKIKWNQVKGNLSVPSVCNHNKELLKNHEHSCRSKAFSESVTCECNFWLVQVISIISDFTDVNQFERSLH